MTFSSSATGEGFFKQSLTRLRRALLGDGNVAGGVFKPPLFVNSGTTKQPEKPASTANYGPIVPPQAPPAFQNPGGKPQQMMQNGPQFGAGGGAPQSQFPGGGMMRNVPPMMQNGQQNGFGGAAPQFQNQNRNMMGRH